ncbi:hypothetical protein MMC16_006305 [Acarospora aff. strigata]|nr:hypothetical protein [Acarospora aff. strigata]
MEAPSTTPSSTAPVPKPEQPWHAAYPTPRNSDPRAVTRSEILQWLKDGQVPGQDFVLVDLRRADHEGGTIRGSINLPAQSLYASIPTLYTLFSAAEVKKVIFYCGA